MTHCQPDLFIPKYGMGIFRGLSFLGAVFLLSACDLTSTAGSSSSVLPPAASAAAQSTSAVSAAVATSPESASPTPAASTELTSSVVSGFIPVKSVPTPTPASVAVAPVHVTSPILPSCSPTPVPTPVSTPTPIRISTPTPTPVPTATPIAISPPNSCSTSDGVIHFSAYYDGAYSTCTNFAAATSYTATIKRCLNPGQINNPNCSEFVQTITLNVANPSSDNVGNFRNTGLVASTQAELPPGQYALFLTGMPEPQIIPNTQPSQAMFFSEDLVMFTVSSGMAPANVVKVFHCVIGNNAPLFPIFIAQPE